MKIVAMILLLLFEIHSKATGQVFITKNGTIIFYSKTPLEDITAENKQAFGVIDVSKKMLAVTVLMKGFEFKKELMQTHFNENYIESDKYPKAIFNGTFSMNNDLIQNGMNKINVSGSLTLHGITKIVNMPATLELNGGLLSGDAEFFINPSDYKIQIPSLVRDNISKLIKVSIHLRCNPSKK